MELRLKEEGVLFSRRDDRFFVGEQDCRDPRKICDGLIRSKERKGKGGIWAIKCRSDKGGEREGEHEGRKKNGMRTTAQRKSKCARVISLPRSPRPPFLLLPSAIAFFPLRVRFPLNVIFRTYDRPDFAFVSCFALRLLPQVPPPLVKLRPCERGNKQTE